MLGLGFSKYFLLWMIDYLTQRIEVSWCKLITGSQIWQQWNSVFLRAQFWVRFSLRASSPVWGSEASLARLVSLAQIGPLARRLGPVILYLYVANLQSELQCDCYQYDDDTTFYIHDGRTWINTKILASACALIVTFPALSWFSLFVRPRCEWMCFLRYSLVSGRRP